MPLAFILQLITLALKEGPFVAETIVRIKNLIANDPNVPKDLAQILLKSDTNYDQALADLAAWTATHPE